jgi:hypothetical protein
MPYLQSQRSPTGQVEIGHKATLAQEAERH